MIEITKLKLASEAAVVDINILLKQLRIDSGGLDATLKELQTIVHDENVMLMVAKDGERVIGMATLYMFTKFGKRSGLVEDVVVDDSYRGQGLGEKLMRALIEEARSANASSVFLTSRPVRVAAHKLYEKLGFKKKETDVFKLSF